jgi:hypothetical protein
MNNNINFEDIMDVSSDDELDSDCISDQSEDLTTIDDKILSDSEISALNGRTKVCAIYFYYTTGGRSILCTSCMINIQDNHHRYAIRKHVIELHDALDGRHCSNCSSPVYTIFPCNMCPMCT